MAKEQAVRVNLSTQVNDIIATMREEIPKAYYYFRKNFGGKQKAMKHEDQMLDKALDDEEDQFTDIDLADPVVNISLPILTTGSARSATDG